MSDQKNKKIGIGLTLFGLVIVIVTIAIGYLMVDTTKDELLSVARPLIDFYYIGIPLVAAGLIIIVIGASVYLKSTGKNQIK